MQFPKLIPLRHCWERPRSDFQPLLEGIVTISGHQGGGWGMPISHDTEANVYTRRCYLPNIHYSHVILKTVINFILKL